MNLQPLRQAASLLLCLLMSASTPGQQPQLATASANTIVLPDPKRALKLAEAGAKAEAEGRVDEALRAYDEAARLAPQDLALAGRSAGLRSRLIREHVDKAEQLALAGKLPQAKQELRAAMRIDPSNKILAERYTQMESMQDDEPQVVSTEGSGIPRLKLQGGRHSFDFRGDTHSAYEQVAQAFGIKVTFDPDVVSRQVRMQLDGVDFNTTVSLVGTTTGTFWTPVNEHLMFVAPDTLEKRRQFGLQAQQTFALSSAASPEEMTELLRMLREITGTARIDLDASAHSVTMRDSPDRLALAAELIHQVDRARGEVMLEMELLEVDRDKAQQLGITPPSSAQLFLISPSDIRSLQQATDLNNALTILGQLFTANGFSSVPGFALLGGGYTTFLLTLPGTAANFSDALSLVQSGQQVLLRGQDGKPATFFVGDRFPITLSLLSGSLGTAGNSTTNSNSFLGVPTSTTFPETSFAVGNNPVALAANDFNSDGLPDLAVANRGDNTISILLNQELGNFVAANSFALPKTETGPSAIAAGAFGNTVTTTSGVQILTNDLVITNSTSNNVSVLLGNGDGTFQEAAGSPFAVGANPSSVVIADFNGDGNLDFAVANQGDNTISVFRGNGAGGFTEFPGSPFALTNTGSISEKGPVAMVTGNFRGTFNSVNNSPEVDLAVVNQATNNVAILLGSVDANSNISFTEAANSPVAVGQSPVAIATSDLNGDTVPDLAVVNQGDNSVSILLGNVNLDATFAPAIGSPLPTAATPAGIVVANFTGGNFPSLAVTNKGQSTLGIYIGLGDGTFSSRIEVATPASPSAIVSAVLTSSSLPDVAFTALGSTPNQGVVTVIQDSSAFATGTSTTQTPYPASEYEDLGVKVKATPTLHANHEVTLQLEFEIRALSGANINGIPIISNRTLTQTVRVKDDETTLISGLLDNEETRSLLGLPGLAHIPGLGYAFGGRNNSLTNTELMILITPRRLRDPIRSARSIFAGRNDASAARGGIRGNIPLQQPPQQPQP
ncbi:MAG TPA: FG-GAP-like repeat-containing protein [Candidatus Acidoferrum sp.]|nr:FG-GAP-like repeat-containing protein [Candidatus Acidoferrum sp.]